MHQGSKMVNQENWLDKQFDFDFPASRYVDFLAILQETPARVAALVAGLPPQILTRREGDSWSIQENAGHFITTESLFLGRLEDYDQGAPVLRPARFEDNLTDQANFNHKEIGWILDEFRTVRAGYMQRLEALAPDDFAKTSLHPRLNKPMRLCDMLFFHVEHDHHHLARIEALKHLWDAP